MPSVHSLNDTVTFALPLPASLGTRTGTRNSYVQQRWSKRRSTLMGGKPERFGGNSIVISGSMPSGTRLGYAEIVRVPRPGVHRAKDSVVGLSPRVRTSTSYWHVVRGPPNHATGASAGLAANRRT